PQADHALGKAGSLLEVVLSASGDFAKGHHLGSTTTEHAHQAAMQVGATVQPAILFWHLDRDTTSRSAWHDTDLTQRIGTRREVSGKGVASLVVSHNLPFLRIDEALASNAQQDLVQRFFEIDLADLLAVVASGCQRRLVYQVCQVSTGETGGTAAEEFEVNIL